MTGPLKLSDVLDRAKALYIQDTEILKRRLSNTVLQYQRAIRHIIRLHHLDYNAIDWQNLIPGVCPDCGAEMKIEDNKPVCPECKSKGNRKKGTGPLGPELRKKY